MQEDLERNFAPDLVVLTRWGVFRGYDGMRQLAAKLRRELPDARFSYDTVAMENGVGFLAWKGRGANGARVEDGADSYVVRDGRIVAQTIHYTVTGG
ncbi:nuclear transport factor 2 family protein [Azospirillum sp. ST 5-10]|uniref:nuclear transport factor 2 family protein n=1 Tax=unclassified Azospirillum TaxID=2630922 RepID=UPI003F4A4BD8